METRYVGNASMLVAKMRNFIAEEFLLGEDPEKLNIEESLLEQGIIDSTGVIELVQFVETEFSLPVPDADVIPANFGSIAALAEYVAVRKEQVA